MDQDSLFWQVVYRSLRAMAHAAQRHAPTGDWPLLASMLLAVAGVIKQHKITPIDRVAGR